VSDSPRIYVASLSDYNAGTLHGEWLDLEDYDTADEVFEAINEMLAKSPENELCQFCGYDAPAHLSNSNIARAQGHSFFPGKAEEFAIHDYEGFGSYSVHEYSSIRTIFPIAKLIAEHGAEKVAGFLDNISLSGDEDEHDLEEMFSESYFGTYKDEEDFAREYYESMGEFKGIPWKQVEEIDSYINWESVGSDLLHGFYTHREDYETLHVYTA
jgi:antirestriction protein